MSDLISRSALNELLDELCVTDGLYNAINNLPTAYDIEAVVKELEEELQSLRNARHKLGDAMLTDKDAYRKAQILTARELTMFKAIEIVRKGGVKNER